MEYYLKPGIPPYRKKRLKNIIRLTPMKRIASPKEISEIIYFVASSKAAYLSGDTIFVTGGR